MTTMVNQVQCSLPILFSFAFLAGFLVSGESANLRAGFSNSVTEESTIIQDSDLVEGSSYLVIQLDGYDMQDLRRISPQKQAIIECAFHEAFNEIHGDNDGLYLSGQQVVAADRSDEEDDNGADDALVDGIGFGFKYVHRPRKFPPKNRDRPSNPPPREYKKKYSWEDKWNIYWHTEFTGMCNLCIDDDGYDDDWNSMEGNYESLSSDNDSGRIKNLELSSKRKRAQRAASNHVMSETSVNSIADALRKNLIEGSCVENRDDSFEYVRNTDIYVLSQSDFEKSVAAITASMEVKDDKDFKDDTNLAALPVGTAAELPYIYGEGVPENFGSADTGNDRVRDKVVTGGDDFGLFKIGLWGVDCGPWNNEDLLDLNSALHDAINAVGVTDRGHVMDKIVPRKGFPPRFRRRYSWKCHFDVYTRLGLDRTIPKDYVLADVGDGLCDYLGRFGWKNKFRNVIDCSVDPVTETDYRSIVTISGDEEAGIPVASA